MAIRGAKPTPVQLRIVDGSHRTTRHGDIGAAREAAAAAATIGPLECPKQLTGAAKAAWDRYIAPAWWLDRSKEPAAIAFCQLWKKFRKDADAFPASNHGQMRAYMSELGLTDERNRMVNAKDTDKDEFFDD